MVRFGLFGTIRVAVVFSMGIPCPASLRPSPEFFCSIGPQNIKLTLALNSTGATTWLPVTFWKTGNSTSAYNFTG